MSISNANPSEVQVKQSPIHKARLSWLTITLAFVALAGVLGTIGVTVVTVVILRQTATTTSSMSTKPLTNVSSTPSMCSSMPSPRPSNMWYILGNMSDVRTTHTSTFISGDNSVTIAGGSNVATTLISTDKYIPSTGCIQSGLNMPRARRYHTADTLSAFPNYILLSGGIGTSLILNVTDLFNPITGYTLTLSLTTVRYAHVSAPFSSSQVVLTGGIGTSTQLQTADATFSGSTATFSMTSNTMVYPRSDHTATRLGNNSGVVLIAGGRSGSTYYPYSELYYGASNLFLPLGSGGTISSARAYHTATYLSSVNKVLITGGHYDGWNNQNTMTLFDVATLSFTDLTTTMFNKRSWHTATLLSNGKVLLVGGFNGTSATTQCDLVDPTSNYFTTSAGNLNTARYQHTATFIPDSVNGTVLICGGTDGTLIFRTCELYIV